MKAAIEAYLDREERFQRERREDRERWERYLDTGEYVAHGDMTAWFDELAEKALENRYEQ